MERKVRNKNYIFVSETLIDTFMCKAGQNILRVNFVYLCGQKYLIDLNRDPDIKIVIVNVLIKENTQLKSGLIEKLKQKLTGYYVQINISDNIDSNYDCPISLRKFDTLFYRAELDELIYGESILED